MLLTSILIEEFRPIKNEGAALVGRFVRMDDRLSNLLRRLPKAGRLRELV